MRGKGVFEKVISAIKLLKEENFNEIFLSMVIGDFNEGLQERFEELNQELGTQSVIRAFVPIGRGKENKEIFVDSRKVTEQNLSIQMKRLKQLEKEW